MPDVTVINFSDLSPGTVVTDQYALSGAGFIFAASGYFSAGLPTITAPAERPALGRHALAIRNCSGEFCPSSVRASFAFTHGYVSVFVASRRDSADVSHVTLYAYDASGAIVAQTSAVVDVGAPYWTNLKISRPMPDIDAFEVRATGFFADVLVREIEFDKPDTMPAPDFALVRVATLPEPDGVFQGSTASIRIGIVRRNGSSGDVLLDVAGLPDGVVGSFTPNPAGADVAILTLTAAPDAMTGTTVIIVRGVSTSTSVGPGEHTLSLPLVIAANFGVSPLTIDVPPCTAVGSETSAYIPYTFDAPVPGLLLSSFRGTVKLSLDFGTPELGVSLDPWNVTFDGTRSVFPVRVAVEAGPKALAGGPLHLVIRASCPPYPDATAALTLRPVAGHINDFTPTVGDVPEALQPGTEITISGDGFCSPLLGATTAQFGNRYAIAPTTGFGTSIRARVPRLATSGVLELKTAGGTAAASKRFTVRSYRNTNGFRFKNFDLNDVGMDDLDDAFGSDQTHLVITLDPCAPLPLVPSCPILSISTIRNPFCWVLLPIAKKIDAHCFGMSVTAERLRRGERSYLEFEPPGAWKAWDLAAADGPAQPLAKVLKYTSISQLSAEFLHYWLGQVDDIFTSADGFAAEVPTVRAKIEDDLRAGNRPFVMMRNGSKGHVVVAVDIEEGDGASVAFYIDIYDPNVPFDSAEDGTPDTHLTNQQTNSRITIYTDGRWYYPGKGGWGPGYFHSREWSLVVTPYHVIPLSPTFPLSLDGLSILVFGSGEITQIRSASGRALFDDVGKVNLDPATRLRAAPYALFDGNEVSAWIVRDEGTYVYTVTGQKAADYSATVMGRGYAATVDAATRRGARDELSLEPAQAALTFRSGHARRVSLRLMFTGSDGAHRIVTLATTSSRGGMHRVSYDAVRDEVAYQHVGKAASCKLTLAWVGRDATPGALSTAIRAADGDSITLRPADWRSLSESPASLTVLRPNGKRTTRKLQPRGRREKVNLRVKTRHTNAGIEIELSIRPSRNVETMTFAFGWMVMQGEQLVGVHHLTVRGTKAWRAGHREVWLFKPSNDRGGAYQLTAQVIAVPDEPTGSVREVRSVSLNP